ncbi:hypothetical protein [Aurantibacter sp.]|uniref:hypothetical protein n=1 Tax=Aurantibacter sp. TaxID=2807103 RepID=UPI003263B638
MKKLLAKIITMLLATILLVACNKGKDNLTPVVTSKTFVPKVITLVYSYGRTAVYTMDYNDLLQLKTIDILYKTDDGENKLQTKIGYDETGLMTTINIEDANNELNYATTFYYDLNNDISDLEFVIEGVIQETNFQYDPNNRIYAVDGELGNFPMGWRFDEDNNLTEMSVTSNLFMLTSSESEKGVFQHLDLQPALTIWYGLLFYLSPYELYFFNQKDLDRFKATEFYYDYEEKVRDENGNLIAFKMVPDNPLAGTISYTISYKEY